GLLQITISDPVGIPYQGIIALSVPFLSNKTASEIVTGEIGSGFFNVYREAVSVQIRTIRDGVIVTMNDFPEEDESSPGRVLDVRRFVKVGETSEKNGTKITITSRHNKDDLPRAGIQAMTFTKQVLGLISNTNAIKLNGDNVQLPLQKLYETEHFEVHMAPDQSKTFNSYIMTKGVPFAPLLKYIKSLGIMNELDNLLGYLEFGVRLNVKSGIFTPTQTRTKIGLTKEAEYSLFKMLVNTVYVCLLYKYYMGGIASKNLDAYLTYYSSTASWGQLLPPSNVYTQTHLLTLSLSTAITELKRYKMPLMDFVWPDDDINPDTRQESKKIGVGKLLIQFTQNNPDKATILTNIDAYFTQIGDVSKFPLAAIAGLVKGWIQNKDENKIIVKQAKPTVQPKNDEPEDPDQEEDKDPNIEVPVAFDTFIKAWCGIYWQVAFKLGIFHESPPKFELAGNLTITTAGVYILSENKLMVNYKLFMRKQLEEIIAIFKKPKANIREEVLKLNFTNAIWRQFFMSSGVIAHEMEHARTKGSHAGGHSSVTMNLPFGGEKTRVFLEQHTDVMQSLIQANFFEEVVKNLK
ncbi:MAG: hypothetical protein ACMG6E_08120, partial [Candidatus Roizmanbacteria bacterium]